MYNLMQRAVLLACVFLIAGCYEDTCELTLNADGSGTIRQRLVFSERFIVGFEESDSAMKGPVAEKDQIIEQIGKAVKIGTIDQKDMPDGSRVIEFAGTFSSPEQFFLSEYCREQLKLRIAPARDGQAAIYCDMEMSEGAGPSVSQLYALAKDLHIKRTVRLPANIQKANGDYVKGGRTVSWATDLRDRKGLARTKDFIEGTDAGKGFAIFDASKLKFDLPLKGVKPVDESSKAAESGNGALRAEVSWISVSKKLSVADGESEIFDLEIGVNLTWEDGDRPVSCYSPVLLSLSDDSGNDLVKSSSFKSLSKIRSQEKSRELKIKAKAPQPQARTIRHITGHVEVISDAVTEVIELKNIQAMAGKDSTGNKVLDEMGFEIKSIKGNTIKIAISAGKDMIVAFDILRDDGGKLSRRGSMSSGKEASYDFAEDLSELDTCRIEVVVSQTKVNVPFSLESVPLP